MDLLGADFVNLDSKKAKEYGITGGVVVKKINSDGALYDQTRMKDGFVILKVNDKDVNNVDEMRKIIGNEKSVTISGFYPGDDGLYEYPITLE
jgi:S1-C subfamily serine protease